MSPPVRRIHRSPVRRTTAGCRIGSIRFVAVSSQRSTSSQEFVTDLVVAVAAFAFCVIGAALVGAQGDEPNLTIAGGAVLALQCAPLIFRRRSPAAVLAVAGVATAWYGLTDWPDPLLQLGVFVALATVVERCSRRTAVILWTVSAVAATVAVIATGDSDAVDVWVVVVTLVVAPLLGAYQRTRNAYLHQLEEAAQRAVEEHGREVRAAQLAERAHLARELHDAVAHHVSVIVVQAEAGASSALAKSNDAVTANSFDAIADTGRTALNELRVLLGVLRTEDGPAPTTPQPGIDRIDDLVRRVRETGMLVDLHIEGSPRPLPPAVDLSAYRIVQEGLTNVLKHSDASRAEVTVRFDPDILELAVRDYGHARQRSAPSGHGLDGLRERVTLLHGTLTAGQRPAGGFELAVSLPVKD